MACGCKNKTANAANTNAVKPTSTQESEPQKNSTGARIIKREIR